MQLNRRFWFQVHGWLSLPVWVLFCFVTLTGTVAVVSHEITWLTNPDARAANPHDAEAMAMDAVVAVVEAELADAEIARAMRLEPYLITPVWFSSPDHPNAVAYVNQYTGEIQAINTGITFIEFMRALHGWLLFPWQDSYSIGYYLVGAMSFVTLGALATGPIIYKRFWRAFTRPRLRIRSGGRAFLGDFHRLVGTWSLWFLLVMGLTGLWYLTQGVIWHNGGHAWEHPDPLPLADVPVTEGAPPQHLSLSDALTVAQREHPALEPAWIVFPEHSRGHFDIAGSGDAFLYDQYAYRTFINPWTGEVVQNRRPAGMNVLQTLTHVADPLHYGTLGGLWTKLLWFVFGVLLTSMSITGFLIWTKRTVKATREARAPARRPPATAPRLKDVRP